MHLNCLTSFRACVPFAVTSSNTHANEKVNNYRRDVEQHLCVAMDTHSNKSSILGAASAPAQTHRWHSRTHNTRGDMSYFRAQNTASKSKSDDRRGTRFVMCASVSVSVCCVPEGSPSSSVAYYTNILCTRARAVPV